MRLTLAIALLCAGLASPAVAALGAKGGGGPNSAQPPVVISGISSGSPTATTATITWTNAPAATGQVQWGLTTSYGNTTTRDSIPVTSDSAFIGGLAANTTYHYKINAIVSGYSQGFSTDQTFTTAASAGAFVTLTPSSSGTAWSGTALSGFTGGVAPPSPTETILGASGDNTGTGCGAGGCLSLQVASTTYFTNAGAGIACFRLFNASGLSQPEGCFPYYVINGTHLGLNGTNFAAGDSFATNAFANQARVGYNFGAQTITGAASSSNTTDCGGNHCYEFTVASTANMATGDQYHVWGVPGAEGQWNVTVDSGTTFHLGVTAANVGGGGGNLTTPGPAYASTSLTSLSIVGTNEFATGGIAERPGVYIGAQNSKYVTVNGASPNRQWIKEVDCAYENSTFSSNVTQSANTADGTDGFVFLLNGPTSLQNGEANLYCNIIPGNGMAKQAAITTWLDSQSGGSGYVGSARSVRYADASVGTNPANGSAVANCVFATDGTGKLVTASGAGCSTPALTPTTMFGILGTTGGTSVVTAFSTPNNVANGYANIATGCTAGWTTCLLMSSVGANLSGATALVSTNPFVCGTGFGTSSQPYLTIDLAANCVGGNTTAATGNSNGNGSIVYATGGGTFIEYPGGSGVGTHKANTRAVEVRPCNLSPISNCTSTTVYAQTVTAVTGWSSGAVTLTLNSVPSGWTVGTKVLVSGMFPAEYNGYVTLTGAVTGAAGTISYACCTVPGQIGELNPAVVHPDATTILGQAVIPYIERLTGNSYITSSNSASLASGTQLVEYEGGVFDGATIKTVLACAGSACAPSAANCSATLEPFCNNFGFDNGAFIDTDGPAGPSFGAFGLSYVNQPFTNTSNRNYSMEEMSYDWLAYAGSVHLTRNLSGYVPWTLYVVATASSYNFDFNAFVINVGAPVQPGIYPLPTATGNWSAGASSLTVTSCAGAQSGWTVYDVQNASGALLYNTIGTVSSCGGGTTINLTGTAALAGTSGDFIGLGPTLNNSQPWPGVFQIANQRLTFEPADNSSTTPCNGSNGPNCLPAVAPGPSFTAATTTSSKNLTVSAVGSGSLCLGMTITGTGLNGSPTLASGGPISTTTPCSAATGTYTLSVTQTTGQSAEAMSGSTFGLFSFTFGSYTQITTFNIYTSEITSSQNGLNNVWIQGGNCLGIGPSDNGRSDGAGTSGTGWVTLYGNYTTGGICAGSGLALADGMIITSGDHQDWVQVGTQPNGDATINFDSYQQRVTYINPALAPEWGSNAYSMGTTSGDVTTTNLTSSGDTLTVSTVASGGASAIFAQPKVGDMITVLSSGSNFGQSRKITAIPSNYGSTGNISIAYPFFPDISSAVRGVDGKQINGIACVGCRIGGNGTGQAQQLPSPDANASGLLPYQVGNMSPASQWIYSDNNVIAQSTWGYRCITFELISSSTGGSGFDELAIMDSIVGAGVPFTPSFTGLSYCGDNQTASIGSNIGTFNALSGTQTLKWLTSTSAGLPFTIGGYTFDTNNWSAYTDALNLPGTNITAPGNGTTTGVTLTDSNYRPTGGVSANGRGYQGSTQTGPLFPFTGDGVPAASIDQGAMNP